MRSLAQSILVGVLWMLGTQLAWADMAPPRGVSSGELTIIGVLAIVGIAVFVLLRMRGSKT